MARKNEKMSAVRPPRKQDIGNKFLPITRKTPFTLVYPGYFLTIGLHMLFLGVTMLLNALDIPGWVSSIPALISYIHLLMVTALVSVEIWTRFVKFGGQSGLRLVASAVIIYFMVVSAHAQLHMAIATAESDSYIFLNGTMNPFLRYFRSFYLAFDVMGGLGTGSVVGVSDLARAVIISNILFQNVLGFYVVGNILAFATDGLKE